MGEQDGEGVRVHVSCSSFPSLLSSLIIMLRLMTLFASFVIVFSLPSSMHVCVCGLVGVHAVAWIPLLSLSHADEVHRSLDAGTALHQGFTGRRHCVATLVRSRTREEGRAINSRCHEARLQRQSSCEWQASRHPCVCVSSRLECLHV